MIRKNSNRPTNGGGSRRPGAGSIRNKIPGMVRRTLGDTDLKSLRSSFKDVFRRGTLREEGEEKETGGSPSIGGSSLRMEGTAEEAMIDHLGSPTCQPSVSPTTVDTPSSVTSSMEDAITPAINGGIISSSSLSSPAPVPPPVPEPDVPPKEAELLWTKPSHLIVNRSSSSSGGRSSSAALEDCPGNAPQAADGLSTSGGDHFSDLDKLEVEDCDGTETLSRNHPIFEILRNRKLEQCRSPEAKDSPSSVPGHEVNHSVLQKSHSKSDRLSSPKGSATSHSKLSSAEVPNLGSNGGVVATDSTGTAEPLVIEEASLILNEEEERFMNDYYYNYVDRLVLKTNEHSCYHIDKVGGTIGREQKNTVAVPSDSTLDRVEHASIDYVGGSFYLVNKAALHCAAIRIGIGTGQRDWPLIPGSAFSVGNSVFYVKSVDDQCLWAEVLDGPLKGERKPINKSGATLGRSPDNTVSISDPELSRRHSKIEYDHSDSKYYLCDVGSTNGTYMQLVGPYAGDYKLALSDQIMVGRTGFSINRFDYGISEERGRRKTMEDRTIVIQDLGIRVLKRFGLAPQTFAAVFDGHGGDHASAYLCSHLHLNIAKELEETFTNLSNSSRSPNSYKAEELDAIVTEAVTRAFLKTDEGFLERSDHSEAGSTATTVLILGKRFYLCNVGDSRTITCRKDELHVSSKDHKPSREDETRRIREAGGFIFQNRLMGELAVSRAFGDRELKKSMREILGPDEFHQMTLRDSKSESNVTKDYSKPLLIAQPEVLSSSLTNDDQFILLACDGLFDVFQSSEVVDFVKQEMVKHHDSQRTCENLSHTAIHQRVAHDNVSIVLLILNKWWSD